MSDQAPYLRAVGDGEDSPFAPPMAEQVRMVEAMLFASSVPLTLAEMARRMPKGCEPSLAIKRLGEIYSGRGIVLEQAGAGYAFRTAADLGFLMAQDAVETRRLSRAAIETLAIIAYHQPVTRAEIEEIRGVAASRGTLDQLIELTWVKPGRRRATPGRPATYVVTDRFLDHFGLEQIKDLPGLAELRASGFLETPSAASSELLTGLVGGAGEGDIEG